MKAREFISQMSSGSILTSCVELKVKDSAGNFIDIGLDDEVPNEIHGYAIYIKADFPIAFMKGRINA